MILFQITGLRLFGIIAISKSLSYFKINHVISKMSKNSSNTTKPARNKHEKSQKNKERKKEKQKKSSAQYL